MAALMRRLLSRRGGTLLMRCHLPAVADDEAARVETDRVGEMPGRLDIPHDTTSAFIPGAIMPRSFSPRARAALTVTPRKASSGVRPKSTQAMFMAVSSECTGEEPGLRSVATASGTPCRRNDGTGGSLALLQVVEGAGQQRRHRAGPRHLHHAVVIEIFDVIAGKRAVPAASLAPPMLESCSAWSFSGSPSARRGIEHPRRLRDGEGDGFAEDIDRIGEPRLVDRGQRLLADERHVAGAIVLVFGRKGVGAEECGHDIHRPALRQARGRP